MGRPSPWKGSGRQQSDGGRGDPGGPVGPTGPVTAVATAEGPGGQGLGLFQSEPLLPAAKRLGLLSQFGSLFLLFPGGVPLATQPQAPAASGAGPREGRCGPRLPASRTQPDLTATLSRGNRLSRGSGGFHAGGAANLPGSRRLGKDPLGHRRAVGQLASQRGGSTVLWGLLTTCEPEKKVCSLLSASLRCYFY